jgi:hypothetical protein
MKKPKPIEEPEKPVKKKKNRKRWRKKKDPSSNLSSPDPDPNKASEMEQEETPPSKDERPRARHEGKFSIPCIHSLHFFSCIAFKFSINLLYIA